jgi:protocatechuate 3,4-dioxygenase beta subunit
MRNPLFLVLALVAQALCFGQSESATISGRVTDPSGGAVQGAEVVLTNTDTNAAQRTKTNSGGLYVFIGVRPGRYRAAAGATGFKTLIKEDLVLHVQDEVSENFSLTLGSVAR